MKVCIVKHKTGNYALFGACMTMRYVPNSTFADLGSQKKFKIKLGVLSDAYFPLCSALYEQIVLEWDSPPQSVAILTKPNSAEVQALCKEMVKYVLPFWS